jgi:DNA-binding response OmpR family regulator
MKNDAMSPLKVLLIEDDSDFENYIKMVAENFNISLTSARTFKEGEEKIAKGDFSAYLVDLDLPDGSGFDLVTKIRKKGMAPIAVISGVFQDEKTFRKLKEKDSVDFVINKPISRENLEHLFVCLFKNKKNNGSNQEGDFNNLILHYQKTIPEKIEKMTHLIEGVFHHMDSPTVDALKQEVHKIGGNAGSFGFHYVTKICKELEHQLDLFLKKSIKPEVNVKNLLSSFLSDLKYGFQVPMQKTIAELQMGEGEILGFRQEAIVIDEDEDFLNLLHKDNEAFQINLTTEKNPQEGLKMILSENYDPKIAIVKEKFSGFDIDAYAILEKFKAKSLGLSCDFGIILEKDTLASRLQALRKGFKYTFTKPSSAPQVLETIKASLNSDCFKNLRVLILDDDSEVRSFAVETLSEIGVEAKSIQKPDELIEALNSYMPHVLLLDVLLPNIEGISILKALRSDPSYKNLTIVLITNFKDTSVEEGAFGFHADGLFFKPLNKKTLQKRIMDLAEWQVLTKRFFPEQQKVGLASFDALKQKIQNSLHRLDVEPIQVALFELPQFSDLVVQMGKMKINEMLVKIANLLLSKMDGHITPYFLHRSRFAVVFENVEEGAAKRKLEEILFQIQSLFSTQPQIRASIVSLTPNFISSLEVLKKGEQLLNLAKQDDVLPIKVQLDVDQKREKKNVLVVDSDTNILKILKTSLESEDVAVQTFNTGESALEEILQNHGHHPPSLIISERQIPDMDGMELLEKIKANSTKTPPFFFLTVYSSDEDIKKGIASGVDEYITKPFNLSILTQKALRAINKKG